MTKKITFKEALTAYEQARAQQPKRLDRYELSAMQRKELDGVQYRDDAQAWLKIAKKYDAIYAEQQNTDNLNKIYLSNIRVAAFYEILPQAIAIINSYGGKKCGEKTKAAIMDNLKSSLASYNMYIYFTNKDLSINFKALNLKLECYTLYKDGEQAAIIDDNNRINGNLSINDFSCYYLAEHIAEPQKWLNDRAAAAANIKAKYKELDEQTKEFNSTYGKLQGFDKLYIKLDEQLN